MTEIYFKTFFMTRAERAASVRIIQGYGDEYYEVTDPLGDKHVANKLYYVDSNERVKPATPTVLAEYGVRPLINTSQAKRNNMKVSINLMDFFNWLSIVVTLYVLFAADLRDPTWAFYNYSMAIIAGILYPASNLLKKRS